MTRRLPSVAAARAWLEQRHQPPANGGARELATALRIADEEQRGVARMHDAAAERDRVQARALLDAEATRTEETRSALVEALILSGLAQERYLPPALVEGVQARATARGIDYHAALAEAVTVGLHAPPAAAGGLTLSPEHAAAVQALAADRSASPAEVLGELVQSGLRAEIARRERRR